MIQQQSIEVDHHGRTIRGTVYLPGGGRFGQPHRAPTVLLLHGFTGQRMEAGFMFVQLGRLLAEAGIAAVTFDFLNSGESDGSFEHMLASEELADAMHMTCWLRGQPFADRTRLGLLGFSLGGLIAACVCGRTDAYKALTLIAPTTPENLCRHAADASPGEALTYGPHPLHPQLFDDVRRLEPLSDIVRHPRATLIVQGTGDTAVTPQVSARFADALRAASLPVDVEHIADANHGFTQPAHRKLLHAAVVGWLKRRLSA